MQWFPCLKIMFPVHLISVWVYYQAHEFDYFKCGFITKKSQGFSSFPYLLRFQRSGQSPARLWLQDLWFPWKDAYIKSIGTKESCPQQSCQQLPCSYCSLFPKDGTVDPTHIRAKHTHLGFLRNTVKCHQYYHETKLITNFYILVWPESLLGFSISWFTENQNQLSDQPNTYAPSGGYCTVME